MAFNFSIAQLQPNVRDEILAGKGFWYNTAVTGTNALAAAGTGSAPMLYNSKTSPVNVRIIAIKYGMISGTDIEAYIYYGIAVNPVVTLASTTYVQPVNCIGTGGNASQIQQGTDGGWAPITVAIATAPTMWALSGVSLPGATAAGGIIGPTIDILDGTIIVKPGVAFFPYLCNGAGALVASVSILAIEDPIPYGNITGIGQGG
jgi:hypothetical protein